MSAIPPSVLFFGAPRPEAAGTPVDSPACTWRAVSTSTASANASWDQSESHHQDSIDPAEQNMSVQPTMQHFELLSVQLLDQRPLPDSYVASFAAEKKRKKKIHRTFVWTP